MIGTNKKLTTDNFLWCPGCGQRSHHDKIRVGFYKCPCGQYPVRPRVLPIPALPARKVAHSHIGGD